jgi:hypothetical protein
MTVTTLPNTSAKAIHHLSIGASQVGLVKPTKKKKVAGINR